VYVDAEFGGLPAAPYRQTTSSTTASPRDQARNRILLSDLYLLSICDLDLLQIALFTARPSCFQ
jgi:hypothetical protein